MICGFIKIKLKSLSLLILSSVRTHSTFLLDTEYIRTRGDMDGYWLQFDSLIDITLSSQDFLWSSTREPKNSYNFSRNSKNIYLTPYILDINEFF